MATQAEVDSHIIATYTPLGQRLGMDNAAELATITSSLLSLLGVDTVGALPVDWQPVAELATWRRALVYAGGMYDFTADGGSFKRNQMFAQVQALAGYAEQIAAPILEAGGGGIVSGGTVKVWQARDVQDPYSYQNEWVWDFEVHGGPPVPGTPTPTHAFTGGFASGFS